MGLSRLQRQTAWTGARYVLGWVLVALALAPVLTPDWNTLDWGVAAAGGLGLGVLGAAFELGAMPRFAREASPLRAALIRTAFYVVAWVLVGAVLVGWNVSRHTEAGFVEAFTRPEVRAYFRGPLFWIGVVALMAAATVMNFGREVRLVLGPSALAALLTGRYRVPVREERAFLFLDLTDSTGLAQRLGPADYHAFKNAFFRDVAAPILATGGQIYQYVGDEVVVTWRVRDGRLARHPAETFFLLDEAIASRAERYRQRYGEVPRYKAGLHAGEVVTAEVGTLKKDLVHTGDAVNVAARVEGQCHAVGARLLVSEAALGLAPLPAGMEAEEVGAVELRGREGTVRLLRLTARPEDSGDEPPTRVGSRTNHIIPNPPTPRRPRPMTNTNPFGPKGWTPERLGSLAGKTYVITGANAGAGFEATRILLSKGASVVMLNRNPEKSAAAIAALKDELGSDADVSFVRMDLAVLDSVREAAAEVLATVPHIDALICNAAIAQVPTQEITVDGFESQLGVNHYGHFLLCGLLFERVEASGGRIVVVASEGYKMGIKTIQFDDMNWDHNYHPNKTYCHSKLAQMMFAYELQDRIEAAGKDTEVYVCHPGASATSLIETSGGLGTRIVFGLMSKTPLVQSAEKGAYPEVMCATEDGLDPKAYYGPTGPRNWTGPVGECELEPHAKDKPVAETLWAMSEEATGLGWSA